MPRSFTSQKLQAITVFFGSSFFLHLLWENLQAPLFAGYRSFSQHFWICFRATWGDLVFMAVLYSVPAVVHRNVFWITNKALFSSPMTWMSIVLIGMALAVGFEGWAVFIDQRWSYAPSMPLLPFINVGLTPVLQMIVIPPVALLISSRFTPERDNEKN